MVKAHAAQHVHFANAVFHTALAEQFPRGALEAAAQYVGHQRALVHAEEAAAEAAGGLERGARTGERIKDQFALAGGATHDALKQRQGLLRIVSCALRIALLQVADVVPHVRGRHGIVVVIGVDAAAGADGAVDAAIGVDVAAHVVLPWLRGRAEHGVDIEVVFAALAVKEYGIVLAAEIAPRRAPVW